MSESAGAARGDMAPLRFCMVTTFYPPYHFGGDAIAVRRLARALVRRGHEVTVLHNVDAYRTLTPGAHPVPAPGAETDDGVCVVALGTASPLLSTLVMQQTGTPGPLGPALRDVLARGFDVIHYHNVSLAGGPGVLRYGRAIKLYTAHEHWLVCPTHVLWRHGREPCTGRQCLRCVLRHRRPPQLWRAAGALGRGMAQVDAVIAMSEFSRAKHREFGHVGEMTVIPGFLPDGAADRAGIQRPHQRSYFLCVARLNEMKGVADLIPMFAGDGEADLLIAGTGEQEQALRRAAAGSPRIRFLGHLPEGAIDAYYAHAVALLVPTRGFETFGLVVIEAFRHGTPVIARRIGPLPELVAGSGGGELFDTSSELRAAIEGLVRDPARRERLGAAARQAFLEHWSEDVVMRRYLALVESLRSRSRRAPAA